MFDAFARDAGVVAVLVVVGLIILAVQLVLCAKARKLIVKLLPAILLVAAIIIFYALIFIIQDRAAIGFGIFAVFAEVLLFFDVVAWVIWGIIRLVKRK